MRRMAIGAPKSQIPRSFGFAQSSSSLQTNGLLLTMLIHLLLFAICIWQPVSAKYRCHDRCSGHGICNDDSYCWCYSGYTGPDCSMRTCARDRAWADKAIDIDRAHSMTECAGRGLCNRKTVSSPLPRVLCLPFG